MLHPNLRFLFGCVKKNQQLMLPMSGALNFDEKPGYSGVPNPLYANPNTIMMLDDANASANALISCLSRSVGIPHHVSHRQERTGP
jgi:hypothetical protein